MLRATTNRNEVADEDVHAVVTHKKNVPARGRKAINAAIEINHVAVPKAIKQAVTNRALAGILSPAQTRVGSKRKRNRTTGGLRSLTSHVREALPAAEKPTVAPGDLPGSVAVP